VSHLSIASQRLFNPDEKPAEQVLKERKRKQYWEDLKNDKADSSEAPEDARVQLQGDDLEKVFEAVANKEMKLVDGAAKAGIVSSTFHRRLKAYKKGGSLSTVGHRHSWIHFSLVEEIHYACHKRSNEGLGFSSDENFLRFIVPYIRRSYVLFERTEKSKESINMAHSSLHTMMKTYVPEKVSQGDRNNLNRIRASANLVIHLIAAVVTFSVLNGENGGLYPEDPTGIRPDKIFTSDATTVLINQTTQAGETRVAKGTGKRMRQQGMGVSAPSNAAMVEHLRDVALAA